MDFSFVLMYGMMHGRVRDVWLYNERVVCIFIHCGKMDAASAKHVRRVHQQLG